MTTESETRLREALAADAQQFHSDLSWEAIVRRAEPVPPRRRWVLPLAAAVAVATVVGVAVTASQRSERVGDPGVGAPPSTGLGSVLDQHVGSPDAGVDPYSGDEGWRGEGAQYGAYVFWDRYGTNLVVITYGSSTCPRFAERVEAPAERMLAVKLAAPVVGAAPEISSSANGSSAGPMGCTWDLVPATTIMKPPLGVTPGLPWDVHVDGRVVHLPAQIVLTDDRGVALPAGRVVSVQTGPPAATLVPDLGDPFWGKDMQMSGDAEVYWAKGSEHLVVVTSGSSSCPTDVVSVVRTAEQKIRLTTYPMGSPEGAAPSGICVNGGVPTTFIVDPPPGITSKSLLIVEVASVRTIRLSAR